MCNLLKWVLLDGSLMLLWKIVCQTCPLGLVCKCHKMITCNTNQYYTSFLLFARIQSSRTWHCWFLKSSFSQELWKLNNISNKNTCEHHLLMTVPLGCKIKFRSHRSLNLTSPLTFQDHSGTVACSTRGWGSAAEISPSIPGLWMWGPARGWEVEEPGDLRGGEESLPDTEWCVIKA